MSCYQLYFFPCRLSLGEEGWCESAEEAGECADTHHQHCHGY